MFNTGNNNTQSGFFGRGNYGPHNGLIHSLNQLIDERINMFFQPSFNQRNNSGIFNQGSLNTTNQTTQKHNCFCTPNQRNRNTGLFSQSQNINSFSFNNNNGFGANTNTECHKSSLFKGNQHSFGQYKQNICNDQYHASNSLFNNNKSKPNSMFGGESLNKQRNDVSLIKQSDNKDPSSLFGNPLSFKDNNSNISNQKEADIENKSKTINECSFTIDKEKQLWDYINKLERKISKLDDENKDLILKMDNLVRIMKEEKETDKNDSFKDSQDDFIILSEHSNKKEISISNKTKVKCIRYQQLYKEGLFKLPSFNTREQDMIGIKSELYRPNQSLAKLFKLLKDPNNMINKDFDWGCGNLNEYIKSLDDQEHLINIAMGYINKINLISRTSGVKGYVGMPGIYPDLNPLQVLDAYDDAYHYLSELLLLNEEFRAFLEEILVKE